MNGSVETKVLGLLVGNGSEGAKVVKDLVGGLGVVGGVLRGILR